MRRALLLVGMVLAAGCPKRSPVSADDYAAPPHLPAPRAGTYARVPQEPVDPVIGALVDKRRWDASLSGAAAGLALGVLHDDHAITGWRVREASWRAGYPYPVRRVRAWSTPPGAEAPDELLSWLEALPAEADLGLVRGRNDSMDVWIAMMAEPRLSVGVQPRQVQLGARVELPAIPGCSYAVADPSGQLYEGALDISQRFDLEVPGEWLFRVDDGEGSAAAFPVYAGMIPPETTLLDDAEASAASSVEERIAGVLASVRELYGTRPWERDPRLDAAASTLLSRAPPETAILAASLGFDPERFSKWECLGTSVEDCLDRVIWDPRSRPGLLGDTRYLGLATEVDAGRVRIVALLAPG